MCDKNGEQEQPFPRAGEDLWKKWMSPANSAQKLQEVAGLRHSGCLRRQFSMSYHLDPSWIVDRSEGCRACHDVQCPKLGLRKTIG